MSQSTIEGIGYLSFFDDGKWFQVSLHDEIVEMLDESLQTQPS